MLIKIAQLKRANTLVLHVTKSKCVFKNFRIYHDFIWDCSFTMLFIMSCQGTICWQSYNKCEWNEELRSLQRFIGELFWEQISLKNSHVPVDMVCLMLYLLLCSQKSPSNLKIYSRRSVDKPRNYRKSCWNVYSRLQRPTTSKSMCFIQKQIKHLEPYL